MNRGPTLLTAQSVLGYSARCGLLLVLTIAPAASAQLTPLGNAVQVAAGGYHTCAVTANGAATCWGFNALGQLGDGAYQDRPAPVDVANMASGVLKVASGFLHSCAVMQAGTVRCWGDNRYGQLGNNSSLSAPTPVDVVGLNSGVTSITAGDYHTCVLVGGDARCWGRNNAGQLGDGSVQDAPAPVSVVGLGGGVLRVAAGTNHTCAITSGGAANCWGANSQGQLGNGLQIDSPSPVAVVGLGSGVTSIAAGSAFTCAIAQPGAAKCWGEGSYGQLGDGTGQTNLTPQNVAGLTVGVEEVTARYLHACALTTTGGVKCWGTGAIGDGASAQRLVPVDALGVASGATDVAAGTDHTCARMATGSVKCWGRNDNGQLGDGLRSLFVVPATVDGLSSGVIAIASGIYHSCAIVTGGTVSCWGLNQFGQLGFDGNIDQTAPVPVAGLPNGITALALGLDHSCALTAGGGVWCWGANSEGQLGDDSLLGRHAPMQVSGLATGVEAIAAGDGFTCALTDAGGVKCWGRGGLGLLGDDTNERRTTPVDVVGLTSGVAAIAARYLHACALTLNGGVQCWGNNAAGELGDGTTTRRLTPVAVSGLTSGVSSITAATDHTCALMESGGVKCWGRNDIGSQLGNGTYLNSPVPVDVAGLSSTIVAVSGGGYHTCAQAAQGIECWGYNFFGQMADGTTIDRPSPQRVPDLSSSARSVSMGFSHGCAIDNSEAKCWGSDNFGQVGNAGRNNAVPAEVLVERFLSRRASDGNQDSFNAASDAAGRFLVFESNAETLIAGDNNGNTDIYRRDTETGAVTRVSVDTTGAQISGASVEPSVSADGNAVLFVAPDAAVPKAWGESKDQRQKRLKASSFGVYLRNLITGRTQQISTTIPGVMGGIGTTPRIAASGQAITYAGMVGGQTQIIAVPILRVGNEMLPGTARCVSCKSIDAQGQDTAIDADGVSRNPAMSENGQWVAWETEAKNTLASVTSPCPNVSTVIVLRNLVTGITQRVSTPTSSTNCGNSGAGSRKPAIDWPGGKIVFESDQPITAGDHNGRRDIFLFDVRQGETQRMSESLDNAYDGSGDSQQATISGDGNVVSFRSAAKNLEPREADNNETEDIYVRRLDQPQLRRVTRNRRGDQADRTSRRPTMNYNGTRIAFDTDAANLALDDNTNAQLDGNGVADVYQANNPATADVVFRSGFD